MNYQGLTSVMTYQIAQTMNPLIANEEVFSVLVAELGKLTQAIKAIEELDKKETKAQITQVYEEALEMFGEDTPGFIIELANSHGVKVQFN